MTRIILSGLLFFSCAFSLEINKPLFPSGEKLKKFVVNTGLTGKAFFVDNNNTFITIEGEFNYKINFFNIQNKKMLFQILAKNTRITYVSIANNNPYLVYVEQSDERPIEIKLFDIENKRVIETLVSSERISACFLTNDAKYIVYATEDNKIRIYDIKKKKFLSVFTTQQSVKNLKVDATNKHIFSLEGNTIVMYDFKTFERVKAFDIGNHHYANKFDISKDAKYMLFVSFDALKVWDIKSKELVLTLKAYIKDAKFTNDSKQILYGEKENLKVINIGTKKSRFLIQDSSFKEIYNISVANNSNILLNDRFLINLKTANVINLSKTMGDGIAHYINESIYIKKFNIIFSRDKDKGIKVWNLDKHYLEDIIAKKHKINDMALSKDNKYLIFSTEKSLKVWEIEKKITIKEYFEYNSTISNLAISNSGQTIVFGTGKKLKILDFKKWEIIKEIANESLTHVLGFIDDEYIFVKYFSLKERVQEIKVFEIKSKKMMNHIKEEEGKFLNLYQNSRYYKIYSFTNIQSEIRDILTNKLVVIFEKDNYVYEIFDDKAYIGDLGEEKLDIWDLKEGKIVNKHKKQYYEALDIGNSISLMDTNWNQVADGEILLKKIFYNDDSWVIIDYGREKFYRYASKNFLLDAQTFQAIIPDMSISKDDIEIFFEDEIKLRNNTSSIFKLQVKNNSTHKLYWIEPSIRDDDFTIINNSIIVLAPNEIKNIELSMSYNKPLKKSFSKEIVLKIFIGKDMIKEQKVKVKIEKKDDISIDSIKLNDIGKISIQINKFIDKNLTNLKVILLEGNKSIESTTLYSKYLSPSIETNESITVYLDNKKTFFYDWGKGHKFTVLVDADEIKSYKFEKYINFDMPTGLYILLFMPIFLILSFFYYLYLGIFVKNITKLMNNPNEILDMKLHKLPYYKKLLKGRMRRNQYEHYFSYILGDNLVKVSNFFKVDNDEKANIFSEKANGEVYKIDNNWFEIRLSQNFELSVENFLLYFPNLSDTNNMLNTLKDRGGANIIIVIGETEKEQQLIHDNNALSTLTYVIGLSLQSLKTFLLTEGHTKILSKIFSSKMDRTLISPYQEEGQLRNESYFFGREKILHHIFHRELSNYFIVGARQIGKSSLLRALALKFKEREEVICIPLEDTRYLLKDMARALGLDRNSSLEEIELFIMDSSDTYLFLIDEVDEFVKSEKNNDYKILHAFRSLTQKRKAYFIMAGYYELFAQISFDYYSPIKNFGEVIRLGKLELEACSKLVVEPMDNLGLSYKDAHDGALIITETGQRANLIAMVCAEIIKNLKPFTNQIVRSDIENALQCSKVRDTHYEWTNGSLSSLKQSYIIQIIVYSTVRIPYFTLESIVDLFDNYKLLNVNINELKESLHQLELMYIIQKNNDNIYTYTIPLMKKELEKEDRLMLERLLSEFRES